MSVIHIVAFKTPSRDILDQLTIAIRELEDLCQKDGKKYIQSLKGGHQISTEAFHHDMQVVFVMEFASREDLAYYLDEDPVHTAFKTRARGEFAVQGVVAMDFVDGKY